VEKSFLREMKPTCGDREDIQYILEAMQFLFPVGPWAAFVLFCGYKSSNNFDVPFSFWLN
jgi:hypothetical protein